MPVSTTHKEYDKFNRLWIKVKDCVQGQEAVKTRSFGGQDNTLYGEPGSAYLVPPNAVDISQDNKERFQSYVRRASFVNYTSMTLDGICGLVFKDEIKEELPKGLEHISENATGTGLSLSGLTTKVFREAMKTGRYGLLADYPQAPEGTTLAQQRALGLRATIKSYAPESIINWKTTVIGGYEVLSLVVLKESVEVSTDGFDCEMQDRYRVLNLGQFEDDGPIIYYQSIYDHEEKLVEVSAPKQSNGAYWDYIPFHFVGAEDNDWNCDKPPLLDIANINLSHYENSAEFEEVTYQSCQFTFYISGLNQQWADKYMKDGVRVGSRSAILLPEGGSAGIVQPTNDPISLTGMKEKEQQLIKTGARLITDTSKQETLGAAKLRFAGQNSKVGVLINNVEQAINEVLIDVMLFEGVTGSATIEINRDFYDYEIDPQLLMAEIQLLDREVIERSVIRKQLRSAGIIDKDTTDEMLDDGAETTLNVL